MSTSGPVPLAYSVGLVLCVAFILSIWQWHRLRVRCKLPLPPGPPGLPLIGNMLDLNSAHPWLSYEQWGKKYGSLVYANLLGKDFIIINSAKVAYDLLDQRSKIYSDRPYIPANEIFGMDFNSGLLPYGNTWRLHRELYNASLNKDTARHYQPVATNKACQLVENLLDAPEDYAKHCRTFATATIMAVTYGYDVVLKNDPFVTKIEHFIGLFRTALTPERAALLLAFPLLAHIPSWFPGGGYKQQAAECRAIAKEVLNIPVEFIKDNVAVGAAGKSIVHDLLVTEDDKVDEDCVKAVATSAFVAGAESSNLTLCVFLLAMVLHPEVQGRAQAEIDRVVGTERLPDFGDRPDLPYVEAVYLETLRWRPVAPTGLAHMTSTSDVYEGIYIPKGAVVVSNIWGIEHDETRFHDPKAFLPERHLTPSGTITEGTANYAFGFGRRVCPGRYLADQNVWAAIATILATLRVSKARDEFGNEIHVKEEFTSGLTSGPKPFLCSIASRSKSFEELIRMRNEHSHHA